MNKNTILFLTILSFLFVTGKAFSQAFELNPMILNNSRPQSQKTEIQPVKVEKQEIQVINEQKEPAAIEPQKEQEQKIKETSQEENIINTPPTSSIYQPPKQIEPKINADGTADYEKTDEAGYKTVTTKDKDGNVLRIKNYNEKGILIEEYEHNQGEITHSIYSYKTGKLNQKYTTENGKLVSLSWYDINTGSFIAKTLIGNNGTSKTYDKNNKEFTGSVYGHRYTQDYELKYKNGNIIVSSIFDTLVKIGIIDDKGKFLVEPFYYFKFLARIAIIDGEWNELDKKAITELNKMVDND